MERLIGKSPKVLYVVDIFEKHNFIIDTKNLNHFPSGTEFHIITVIPKAVDITGFLADVINELNEDQFKKTRATLKELITPLYQDYNFKSEVIIDNSIVNGIRKYAQDNYIDCVIINGKRHGFWERYFTGIQERIINGLNCDVIVSKNRVSTSNLNT
ncbi:universal stress protein [Cysteiniphilum halobium]|uniref:universal stress protein n=1 Tax=Cysteiniphilum halobium TaxID=2219059 RepID=UPI003F85400E